MARRVRKRIDEFVLYDLRVEVIATERAMVCGHRPGDYFEVRGEQLSLPAGQSFPIYPLAALLPLLPAKQRLLDPADWLELDTLIACPDIDERLIMRIERIGRRTFKVDDLT